MWGSSVAGLATEPGGGGGQGMSPRATMRMAWGTHTGQHLHSTTEHLVQGNRICQDPSCSGNHEGPFAWWRHGVSILAGSACRQSCGQAEEGALALRAPLPPLVNPKRLNPNCRPGKPCMRPCCFVMCQAL